MPMKTPLRWNLCLSLAIVTSTGIVFGQEQSSRESAGLVGPVRTIRNQMVSARRVDDRLVEEGRPQALDSVTFNAAGRYAAREVVDDYGFVVGTQRYRYFNGHVEERVLFEADGALKQRSVFRYDGTGNVIRRTSNDRLWGR